MRVKRVIPQIIGIAQRVIRGGHKLHQPHGPRRGGDKLAVMEQPPTGFLLHDSTDPLFRHVKPFGCFLNIWPPRIFRRAGRSVVGTGVGTVLRGFFRNRNGRRAIGAGLPRTGCQQPEQAKGRRGFCRTTQGLTPPGSKGLIKPQGGSSGCHRVYPPCPREEAPRASRGFS